MTAIVLKKKINFGAILINWLSKWIEDDGIKNVVGKAITKMYCGRFVSIILKKRLKNKIGDEKGVVLNYNKRITPKLFEDWKKNPGMIKRTKQSGRSSKGNNKGKRIPQDSSEDQKSSKAKGKRKLLRKNLKDLIQIRIIETLFLLMINL